MHIYTNIQFHINNIIYDRRFVRNLFPFESQGDSEANDLTKYITLSFMGCYCQCIETLPVVFICSPFLHSNFLIYQENANLNFFIKEKVVSSG